MRNDQDRMQDILDAIEQIERYKKKVRGLLLQMS